MSENLTETLIGALVLAVAGAFLWFAAATTGSGPAGDSYELRARFRSVEGVSVGTDVRLAGVKIGTVSALGLDPESYLADARLAISREVRIPEDSTAAIASEGLLGGAFVEIIPGGSDVMLEPGQEIEDTQGAVSLINLLMKFAAGGGSGGQ
ncbi:MAG: outer membrane lipid asymmetry maintenance protein MlaD [Alphaproteobacteria bacterium]|nr:MAG: outer membrane lipid asymmetry maintenance protein MlaD [Alphaproteobacteria bacterium]